MTSSETHAPDAFDRTAFDTGTLHIGTGEIGGKATGLTFFSAMLGAEYDAAKLPGIDVTVPAYAVLTTSVFDAFIGQDALRDLDFDRMPDEDIASAFQCAPLPANAVGFLASLVDHITVPLAVRSSSLLEDAIFHPLAGVYETKMVPNNQPDTDVRLRKLVEAVRFVYASTRFKNARDYLRAVGKDLTDEKMAIVIQEVVGSVRGDHFYPHVSGVARSHNFYPTAGARAEEGVVSLALGLGKTIVDGGVCWTYSPARPMAPPPFASVGDLMKSSQLRFWAVNLAAHGDGVFSEAEHLVDLDLDQAEQDGVLEMVASTYVPASDRVVPGTGSAGPRILNFGPLLQLDLLPLNAVIRELLAICERAAGADVEIEFAMAVDPQTNQARFGFLQVRPMFVSNETVDLPAQEFERPDLFLAAGQIMGNGSFDGIRDIVYVKREGFDAKNTRRIGAELELVDRRLREAKRPYVLIGFGRWGTSDPWLGVPLPWSAIAGARIIVESSLPNLNLDPSQGSHFFHNVMSSGVGYLAIQHYDNPGIDWTWLDGQPAADETALIRHVSLETPLTIKLDGQTGRAGIWHGDAPSA